MNHPNQKSCIAVIILALIMSLFCKTALSISLPPDPKGAHIVDRDIGWHPVTGQPIYGRLYRDQKNNLFFDVLIEKSMANNDWKTIFKKNLGMHKYPPGIIPILSIESQEEGKQIGFLIISYFYTESDWYFVYDISTGKFSEPDYDL